LRSGQEDWIGADSIPSQPEAGFSISLWPYPHTYPYVFNCAPGLVFSDVRVRQAMNCAIDHDGLCQMLNGTADPAYGFYPPESSLFGQPKLRYGHDPDPAAPGRVRTGQACQGENHDFDLGLGSDAADSDP